MKPASRPESPSPRALALMRNLAVDARTAEVVESLRADAIASVVLKGPALNHWYPPGSGRGYVDGDLWVAPAHVKQAGEILSGLGFEQKLDERGLPRWWLEHASEWRRAGDGANIDLHRHLQGVGCEPAKAWERLWPRCVEFTLAGTRAHRLPDPGLALYTTLHATHHGVQRPLSLSHVKVALAALDDAVWVQALALARELEAIEDFATGLRLLPGGRALARRIGVPEATSVTAVLKASTPPPVALGIDRLASARGIHRLAVLLYKLFPPPGFIRHWWPAAAQNRRMLLIGYLYRPVWLLRRAPGGYRAWRAARRAANRSS